MTVCGGKKRHGGECQRPAGWGTDHAGTGRCKLHGGGTGTGRPPIHGRYSVKRRGDLQAKIAQFYNDPAAGDLRSELALLRAFLQDYLDRFPDGVPLTAMDIDRIYNMVDAIGKLVERIAKILATTALTQAELQLLQVTLIDAISEFVPEPDRQRAFVSRIAGAFGGRIRADIGSISADTDG